MKSFFCFLIVFATCSSHAATTRWSDVSIYNWYQKLGWTVGANFIPSTASNQLEMWQAATFDPVTIDRELGLAEKTGMTTVRVFLHDLAWQQDPAGFVGRVKQFLILASKHHIKPLFVLFDSCWDPHPKAGPQLPPRPGVHNSRWVQSPGVDALLNPNEDARLQTYVTGIVRALAHDSRILGWDVWNEADNLGNDNTAEVKLAAVTRLLPLVFAWVRKADPSQPITSCIWDGDWTSRATLRALEQLQIDSSDFITFHSYNEPAQFEKQVGQLEQFHRPMIVTEYMARTLGSTVQNILPIAKSHHVGAMNWGFVAGKTQTYFPWDSWTTPYTEEPKVWFHDLYRTDDSPYRADEIAFLQQITRARRH